MANETKLANVINPQVMADMVSAGLPKALKFTPFAKIDTTLVGVPGSEITIPSWNYTGAAEEVGEAVSATASVMTASTKKAAVKKAVKAIALSDEAVLSGYGDPVGEATHQIVMSIADKLDQDVLTALGTATLTSTDAKPISYKGVVNAVDKLNEEGNTEKVLFVAPSQVTILRLDPDFIDRNKYGNDVMVSGEIGMVAGCRVVVSRRINDTGATIDNFIVCLTPEIEDGTPALPAVTVVLKRDIQLVTAYKELEGVTNIVANKHYAVALTNESKVVKATFKK